MDIILILEQEQSIVFNFSDINVDYVPYNGAYKNVNLGNNSITALSGYFSNIYNKTQIDSMLSFVIKSAWIITEITDPTNWDWSTYTGSTVGITEWQYYFDWTYHYQFDWTTLYRINTKLFDPMDWEWDPMTNDVIPRKKYDEYVDTILGVRYWARGLTSDDWIAY